MEDLTGWSLNEVMTYANLLNIDLEEELMENRKADGKKGLKNRNYIHDSK